MEEQGYDVDDPIGPETSLVQDLGFSSLDFVQLIVDIEAKWARKLGFQDLLLKNGVYVKDVSVSEIESFLAAQLSSVDAPSAPPGPVSATSGHSAVRQAAIPGDAIPPITAESVVAFRQSIRPRQLPAGSSSTPKNPRAVFVLSPPRSGTTLFRVILAGHPRLFAPPELYLLMYDDLQQRRLELAGDANSHLLEGTMRALVELEACSADEAEARMAAWEQQSLPTRDFYGYLQSRLGDRLLVDKTPLYPLDPSILARAELDFEEPLYIHLVRHPYGMIRSYEESQLDRFAPVLYENSFHRRQLAELTWYVSHRNILDFKASVPDGRWLQLGFESLVTQPEHEISRLCQFLGLDLDPAMLQPYSQPERRMLSGAKQLTRMPGDLKFHLHKGIDPEAATRWQQFLPSDFLGDLTWDLAEQFGYERQQVRQLLEAQGLLR
ncbi:sulfotransferase [Synechococcus sp. CBW1004]|uniref:sulfotransferase n=1 Tax=Synechococcus sp. CBW1004 TaxID=1353136 RepID=UPI0018CC9DE3|nr:sulfotransferase [Synechococcus sp. CBW1004]QPN62164.1 sulfotransferase [Synechococcus sp. CBW1004]